MKIPNPPKRPEIIKVKKPYYKLKLIGLSAAILMVIGLGVGLIFNKPIMDAYIEHQTKPATYLKVSADQMKKNAAEANKKKEFDTDSAVPVSAENVAKAAMANQEKPVVGGVAVPQLGINLPILADSEDYSMLYGAGPLQPNMVMGEGNYSLASHDMWTNLSYYSKELLFSPLLRAENGQDIYLTDKEKVYHYVTYDVRQIEPEAWSDAVDEIPGKKVVTLITCDTNDEHRILVRGVLHDIKPFSDETAKPFTSEYNQYKG